MLKGRMSRLIVFLVAFAIFNIYNTHIVILILAIVNLIFQTGELTEKKENE